MTGNEEKVSRERASARGAESSEESPAFGQSCAGRLRVVRARDTLSLLTVAELQTGARLEGVPVTGIKTDLVDRLAPCFMNGGEEQPTTRQLKYVLYNYARRAQCKIKYESIRRKSTVSDWIASWKV